MFDNFDGGNQTEALDARLLNGREIGYIPYNEFSDRSEDSRVSIHSAEVAIANVEKPLEPCAASTTKIENRAGYWEAKGRDNRQQLRMEPARRKFFQHALVLLAALIINLMAAPPPACAQYTPIPRIQDTQAGLLYRNAINDRFSGAQAITPKIGSLDYPLPGGCAAGAMVFCPHCASVKDGITMGSTCVGGGSGSLALCKGDIWTCGM